MQAIDEKEIKELCSNIKYLRQSAGWTQEELAKRVGVTRQTITAIENNKMVPSLPLFLALMGIFTIGASIVPILGGVVSTLGLKKTLLKLFD